MLWRPLSNFKMGTLAFGTNCNPRHPPAYQNDYEIKNSNTLLKNNQAVKSIHLLPIALLSILKEIAQDDKKRIHGIR